MVINQYDLSLVNLFELRAGIETALLFSSGVGTLRICTKAAIRRKTLRMVAGNPPSNGNGIRKFSSYKRAISSLSRGPIWNTFGARDCNQPLEEKR